MLLPRGGELPKPFANEKEGLGPDTELSARFRNCSDQANWPWSVKLLAISAVPSRSTQWIEPECTEDWVKGQSTGLVGDLPCARGIAEPGLPVAMLPFRKPRGGLPILIRRKGVEGVFLALLGEPVSSSSTAHSSIDSELVEVLALR